MFSLSSCLQGGNEEVDNGDKKWYDSSTVYGDVYDASNDKNLYFDFSTEPKARCSFMNYCDHLQFENPDISYSEKLILMTANLTQTGIDNLQGKNLRDIKKDAVACESWNLILSS